MSDKISINLELLTQKADEQIKATNSLIGTLEKNAESATKKGTTGFSGFGGAVIVANQALELAGKLIGGITTAFKAGIKAAIIQENAINDLNTALKSTGTFTEEASQDFQDFASSLQKTTTFGDEALLKTAALGAQMAKLSGQELKDATLAAANMASALGIDLDSAMRLIAKSATDGGSGLKRYGIEVEKGTTNSQSLANAIQKVNEQFSGAAESKVNTYQGALTQAQNSWGDLLERIGDFIIKNPVVIAIINEASKMFNQFGDILASIDPNSLNNLVANGIVNVIDGLIFLTRAINPVISGFSAIGNFGMGVFNVLRTGVNSIIAVFASFINIIATTINAAMGFIPKSIIPDGWAEGMEAFKLASDDAMAAVAETTVSFAEQAGANFAAVGDSFTATIDEEKLEMIRGVLTQTQMAIEESTAKNIATDTHYKETKVKHQKEITQTERDQAKAREKLAFEEAKRKLEIEKKQEEQFYFTENAKKKWEEGTWADRISQTSQGLNQLGSLQKSSNKEMAAVGFAANVAQAIQQTYLAATGAYSSLAGIPIIGPALGAAAAAAAVVAGMANVNQIKKSAPKFAQGGIVGGNSFYGDRVAAQVNSGEMVLNRSQQAQLFKQANGGGGDNSNVLDAINRLVAQPIIVSIDGTEIARANRAAINSGF